MVHIVILCSGNTYKDIHSTVDIKCYRAVSICTYFTLKGAHTKLSLDMYIQKQVSNSSLTYSCD